MKKILIILFCFISASLFSQSVDDIRADSIKHIAKGNNTKLYHGATDYKFETNKDGFDFNKDITVNGLPIEAILDSTFVTVTAIDSLITPFIYSVNALKIESEDSILVFTGTEIIGNGTGGSSEITAKLKNVTATDSIQANNLKSNSQTMGAITVTAFGTSKFIMENTPTDKIITDTLLMVDDTISGHDLLLAVRKILYPNDYSSYLPNDSLFTTPSIILNTPTKVLIPTALNYTRNWAFFDKGGSDFALQFQGADSSRFHITATTSLSTVSSNVVFEIFMYKNGVIEPGIASERKIGTGGDVGSISMAGAFDMNTNDYIEIFILVDVTTTVTFSKTSIVIKEDGLID